VIDWSGAGPALLVKLACNCCQLPVFEHTTGSRTTEDPSELSEGAPVNEVRGADVA